jgi:oligoribonuclease NrnB/cAMP/cGMP phosphodiesterase (DHH superfamily)
MTWDYYFGGTPGSLIKHVEDRDLWRFSMEQTRAFQANLFSYEYTFENWDDINNICADDFKYWQFVAEGHAIERKHFKDINELIKVAATRDDIAGFDVPVLNAPYFYSSDAGHIMSENEPFAACYWDTPEGRIYSLRSCSDGLDVSEIAVKFGGGGHKHAAGFKVNNR